MLNFEPRHDVDGAEPGIGLSAILSQLGAGDVGRQEVGRPKANQCCNGGEDDPKSEGVILRRSGISLTSLRLHVLSCHRWVCACVSSDSRVSWLLVQPALK